MAMVVDPQRDGLPFSLGEHTICLVAGALALTATCLLCLSAGLCLGASPSAANLSVVGLTFGTGLFHYGTYDASFSHVYSALGIALLIWLAVHAIQHSKGRLPVVPTFATLGWLVLVRNTNVVLIGFWAFAFMAYIARTHRKAFVSVTRNLVLIGLGVACGVVMQLGLNYHAFNRLQLNSYAGEAFDFSRCMVGHVLWSADRGLFTYYPMIGVALTAGLLARPLRLATLGLAGLTFAVALLYGFWWSWQLGAGFGHRGFVELVPFFIPVLALALDNLTAPLRRCVLTTGFAASYVCLVVMAAYWRGVYPMDGATWHHYCDQTTLKAYRHVYRAFVDQPLPHLRPPSGL
jgi:hypothetical protein